jgi:xylan 1,4-beta-xylosidase
MPRRNQGSAILCLLLMAAVGAARAQETATHETLTVDAHASATPLPHFWEQMFGSGHANLAMREAYRNDLAAVKNVTGMQYVRFHGILDDENGVYTEDEHGQPQYNFTYVDEIYDGLLARGVRPVVEISFMPKQLAAHPAPHAFWYKPNVAPPKDYARWDALIRALGENLVARYGIDEVAQWYFEVWNEPNIDFWVGEPKQSTYFELYSHTARALKSVSPRLRVGGPAAAAEEWVPEFLKYMHDNDVPVDFVSTHGYADENYEHTFTPSTLPPMDDRLCAAMAHVKQQIADSPTPHIPWFVTEWNVIGIDAARDTTFVGPAVANTIRECDGLANIMSFWTFDDVFEEDGPKREPFDGGFGLVAPWSIRKPSFNAFAMLHHLGNERLSNDSKNALVTRRSDGTLVVAVWNMADTPAAQQPGGPGVAKQMQIDFEHVPGDAAVSITRLDPTHGNTLVAYRRMGSPRYPTEAQVRELNEASKLGPPVKATLRDGKIDVDLPVNSLVMLEVATK